MNITTIKIGDRKYRVLVAQNFLQRMRGLAWRDDLDCDGMLFKFPFRARWSIWMLGVKFPITLIWLDDGRVVGIEHIPRPSTLRMVFKLHRSMWKASGLVEVINT